LFVQTDAAGDVYEAGLLANNAAEATQQMDVMPEPFADLVVTSVTPPATAGSGQT
jgi:hypothetical protein